jgi:hypothetical protein
MNDFEYSFQNKNGTLFEAEIAKVYKRYQQEGKKDNQHALNSSMDGRKQVRFENGSQASPPPKNVSEVENRI